MRISSNNFQDVDGFPEQQAEENHVPASESRFGSYLQNSQEPIVDSSQFNPLAVSPEQDKAILAKKNRMLRMAVAILAVVVVVIIIILCLFIFQKPTSTVSNSPNTSTQNTSTQNATSNSRNLKIAIAGARFTDSGELIVLTDVFNESTAYWRGWLTCQVCDRDGKPISEGSKKEAGCFAGESERVSFTEVANASSAADMAGISISSADGDTILVESDSEALREAIESFEKPASEELCNELSDAVNWEESLNPDDYTSASFADFREKAEKAKTLLGNEKLLERDAQQALSDMKTSEGKLVKIAPIVVNGSGDDVIDIPSEYETGIIHIVYNGEHNFSVWSCDEAMEEDDLLVNTIGHYEGTVTTLLGRKKDKHLEISSSGPWTVSFLPIVAVKNLENGQEFVGDDVVHIDASASKLNISYEGEHNFVIRGITSDAKVELVVNEIGSYSGTVPNRKYAFLVVESEGRWSVSW